MFPLHADKLIASVEFKPVVGIEEHSVVARRHAKGVVPGFRHAGIGLAGAFNPTVGRVALNDAPCPVARAVVDHNELDVFICLSQRRLDATLNVRLDVEGRDDY